jgi:HEPN domain-containing protein
MNREDFQHLADVRAAEAQILFDAKAYDGTYYLAGYAVECALKACIAKLTKAHDFPDKQFAIAIFTHDLHTLRSRSNLDREFEEAASNDPNLAASWNVVADWSEVSRYDRCTKQQAYDLLLAVTDPAKGVLPWLKARW